MKQTHGVFTGVISQIGAGTVRADKLTIASVVEIGEHALKTIAYDNFIATYLSQAVNSGEPVAILIYNNNIQAIKLNGKKYCTDIYDQLGTTKLTIGEWVLIIFLGLISFGIAGFAAFLLITYFGHKINKIITPLKAEFERTNP